MPADHIRETDVLDEGRKKLNKAIDQANKAEVDSADAKVKSTNAEKTANQANQKSDYTQTQLDLVTGASTIDPAVEQMKVGSDGSTIYNSPDERVRKEHQAVTAQLADEVRRREQYQGDLLQLLYNYSGLKENVAVRYRATNIIDVAVFYNEKNATVYSFSPDNDGWMRLKAAIKRPMTISKTKAQKNYDSTSGTWNKSQPPFHYTTEVGAKFTSNFYGTGCFIKGRRATDGGIWEVVVDGIYKKIVSCWNSSTSGYFEELIVEGLPEGDHTIVATFLGDDPAHTPSSGAGTARGYINFSSTDGGIGYYYTEIQQQSGIIVLDEMSRKEFAFAAKPASYGGGNVWVPEHGTPLGVMRNISATIYLGDRKVSDIATEHTAYRWYSNVRIMTEFDAFHPSADSSPMWHGRIDQTIDGKGVHIKGTFEFKQDTFIGIGHPAMLAINKLNTKNTAVVDSYGNRYALNWSVSNDTDIFVGEDAFCVAHFCDPALVPAEQTIYDNQRDNVAVIKIFNYQRTMRVGAEDKGEVYTRLKADDTRKTYYVSHRNHTAKAGETFDFGCTYFIGDIFEANKVLPNG